LDSDLVIPKTSNISSNAMLSNSFLSGARSAEILRLRSG